ncbi:hypothetical protein BSKO_08953 [Bryopsis sp. KO-2023]|nr:hypothetical protein BSKO_08953 [Bryopsis sp. KO-2023]
MFFRLLTREISDVLRASPDARSRMVTCASLATDPRKWEWLAQKGHKINPCNSMLHPAVIEAGILPEGEEVTSVQQAYTPGSRCFGCGPSNPQGLGLRSKRIPNGLSAEVTIDPKHQSFPGIVHGGVIASMLECHGNWTAALRLMDQAGLPMPPLTLTSSILIEYKQPTPPNQRLSIKSQVVKVREMPGIGMSKQSVEVDLWLYKRNGSSEELYATASGIFKRRGAARGF